ncbi:L-selectin [Merluccius polli]|uniref:L-selectin n=1 Tax=Merluccius polli TaxID=89951 RepID=A0AA47MWS5_MERPO|nr:L-selectin [Merluccius polli]
MWTGGVAGWSYFHSNTTMDWRSARQWCRDHHTDMVAIQDQQEIAHLNKSLPWQPTYYYWIGIRKVDNVWTWVGTNKSLTDEATNWATGEPNNNGGRINEDCVEMYIQRKREAGTWNDISCFKSNIALCYAAACKKDSCVKGECVEMINSHKCEQGVHDDILTACTPAVCGLGSAAESAAGSAVGGFGAGSAAGSATGASGAGSAAGSATGGSAAGGSGFACNYTCNEGYEHQGLLTTECTQSGQWSSPPPTCTVVHCEELSRPGHGTLECQHPLGDWSFVEPCTGALGPRGPTARGPGFGPTTA